MIFPHIPQVEQEWMEADKSKRDLESCLHFHPEHPAPFLPDLVTGTQSLISPTHQAKCETPGPKSLAQVPGPWDGSLCSTSTAGTPRTLYPGHRGENGRSCTGSPCWPPPAAHRYTPHHCGNNGEQPAETTQHKEGPAGTHTQGQTVQSKSHSATPSCPLKQGTEAALHLWDSLILMGHLQLRHFMIVWHGHSDNFLHLCLVTGLFLPFFHMKELKFVFPGEKTTGSLPQKH